MAAIVAIAEEDGPTTGASTAARPATAASAGRRTGTRPGPVAVAGARREFNVGVRGETLKEALIHVGQRAGWTPRRSVADDTIRVVDEPKALVGEQSSRHTVLVVDPTPWSARRGMRALAAGDVAALVSSDRPRDLVTAMSSLAAGWAGVPLELTAVASRMPDMSERQAAIMSAVQTGQRTGEIARGLQVSDGSVRRELGILFASFGVHDRIGLAALAHSLGLPRRALGP